MNQDLTGTDFSGQDLSYSNFRGSNMNDCDFTGCKLHGINMRDTTVEGTNFTNAEMFYCNQRDAVGTADWTGALVFGVPTWIPMPDSDNTSTPPARPKDPLFDAVFEQTPGVEPTQHDYFTDSDKKIINRWRVGDGDIGQLTGSYPTTEHGRELYNTLGSPGGGADLPMEDILNDCMLQNVTFNKQSEVFYKPA